MTRVSKQGYAKFGFFLLFSERKSIFVSHFVLLL